MLTLRRWEPFGQVQRIEHEMDRFWRPRVDPFRMRSVFWSGDGRISIDVYGDADRLVVKAAVPGVKPEDLELTVVDNTLAIKGETKSQAEAKQGDYLHRERGYGPFSRSVVLPDGLDTDKADASYEDGVLTVIFPKSEESRPKSLKIKVREALSSKPGK